MLTALVAIGGNAINRAGQAPTFENQLDNLLDACRHLARMIDQGYDIVLSHGNGPQVGNILLQNELAKDSVPLMPVDVLVAESQGQLGYMLQQAMTSAMLERGMDKTAICMLTRTVVDPDDPAFDRPSKPIGPYYDENAAKRLMKDKGWTMLEDRKRGGFRRAVPSPRPVRIVEAEAIRHLVFGGKDQNEVVIASGGGGIPVTRTSKGFAGVEAVVDKDLAARVLANAIGERLLIMLTDVDAVYLDFDSPSPRRLDRMTVEEARGHLLDGQFPSGTMGPKIEAAIEFLENGGERAVITSPELIDNALNHRAGTHITRG